MEVAARGRPRQFDVDAVLDRAIVVFWRHGYDGASLAELTAAMEISPPSLYAAFGGKRDLFARAFERYLAVEMAYVDHALAREKLADVFHDYLFGTAGAVTRGDRPHGCMSVQIGGSRTGNTADGNEVRQLVARARDDGLRRLTARIQEGLDLEGYAAGDARAEDIAQYLASVSSGMSLRAADGASREELRAVARLALRTLLPAPILGAPNAAGGDGRE